MLKFGGGVPNPHPREHRRDDRFTAAVDEKLGVQRWRRASRSPANRRSSTRPKRACRRVYATCGLDSECARHGVAAGGDAVGDRRSWGRGREHCRHAVSISLRYPVRIVRHRGDQHHGGTSAAGFISTTVPLGGLNRCRGNSAEMPVPGVLTQFVGKSVATSPVISITTSRPRICRART